jgi:hypothetical protein
MLFWEFDDAALGVVHHLMVLCYHLQHPHLMSPDGLDGQKHLLRDFLLGVTTEQVRRRDRDRVDSSKRTFKIKAAPDSYGSYARPIQWTMPAAEVVAAGKTQYIASIQQWARTIDTALTESGNHAAP